jgi:Transposase DDE domain group 1
MRHPCLDAQGKRQATSLIGREDGTGEPVRRVIGDPQRLRVTAHFEDGRDGPQGPTEVLSQVRFYNKRGTAEQWIKEGEQAVKMTRLSCHRFRSNQVRLALSRLAHNLGNLWRRALPKRIENWSLTSLQQRLVKTGGRLVKHARYYWLLLAEGHLNRQRFRAMLGRIALLPVLAG